MSDVERFTLVTTLEQGSNRILDASMEQDQEEGGWVCATEYDRLAAELATQRDIAAAQARIGISQEQIILDLQAELSAARADAERYRWLRSRNELTGEIDPRGPYVIEDDDGNTRWPTGNQIDAAIDAARAASSAGGPSSANLYAGHAPVPPVVASAPYPTPVPLDSDTSAPPAREVESS